MTQAEQQNALQDDEIPKKITQMENYVMSSIQKKNNRHGLSSMTGSMMVYYRYP
jgi:hypothetical protein